MNYFYYAACPIPSVCLFIASYIFGPANPGDAVPLASLILSDSTLVLSPLLTLLGILFITEAVAHQRSVLWPVLATVISLLPGAWLLLFMSGSGT